MCKIQSGPKESRFKAVKGISKYLDETKDLHLWNPRCVDIERVGYYDADYASHKLDRKRTLASCQFRG